MIVIKALSFQNNILRLRSVYESVKKDKSLGECRVFF